MSRATLAIYRARWQRFSSQLQARWQPLALREKRMVAGMALVLVGLLIWLTLAIFAAWCKYHMTSPLALSL